MKVKGEKQKYTHLNEEFQRIARRDKKFMSTELEIQKGEIRKPSSVINANKQRKIIEWERLEISSRKSEISQEHFSKDGHNKGQKWHGPKRS